MTLSPAKRPRSSSSKRSTPPSANSSAKKRKAVSTAAVQSVKLTNFWTTIAQTFPSHQHDAEDSTDVTIIDSAVKVESETKVLQPNTMHNAETTKNTPIAATNNQQRAHMPLAQAVSAVSSHVHSSLPRPLATHSPLQPFQTTVIGSSSISTDVPRIASTFRSTAPAFEPTPNGSGHTVTPHRYHHNQATVSSSVKSQTQPAESSISDQPAAETYHPPPSDPSQPAGKHRHDKKKDKQGKSDHTNSARKQQHQHPKKPESDEGPAVLGAAIDPTIQPIEVDLKQMAAQFAAKSSSKQANLTQTTLIPDVPPFDLKWFSYDNSVLYCTSSHCLPSRKIYAFDLDQTLIKPKGRHQHPKNRGDWELCYKEVPNRLKEIYDKGYKIVLFTNQKGISLGIANTADLCGKILDLIKKVNIPIQCVIATHHDKYRKPGRAMWDLFCQQLNGGIQPDVPHSVFVGDAAGRVPGWMGQSPRRDHAASDRRFAYDIGLQFQTPEECFLGWKSTHKWDWAHHIPYSALPKHGSLPCAESELRAPTTEMVILIGIQGAGKTTFAFEHYVKHGYIHCNQDLLGSREKVLQLAEKSLQSGTSVVVDRTNATRDHRVEFIALAQKHNVSVKLIEIQTPAGIARRLNAMRDVVGSAYQQNKKLVPEQAFWAYQRDREEPSFEEGIQTIIQVPFIPRFTAEQAKIFDEVLL